mgnify:CR=1 FL=1
MFKETNYFDEIIAHLNRKKAKLNEITHTVCKPQIKVDGCKLYCWHGYSYLYIFYDKNKAFNPYRISIESQWTSGKYQEVGEKFYTDSAPTQADVIECIKRRL